MNTTTTPNRNSRSDFSPAKISSGPPIHQKKPEKQVLESNFKKETKEKTKFEDKVFHEEGTLFHKYHAAVEWIGSRESIFRCLQDFIGTEVPSILAQGTRNFYSFAESVFQASINLTGIFLFPLTTSLCGKILSNFFLHSSEQDNYRHYMIFNLVDLDDKGTFNKAKDRIREEQIKDSYFMENFFGKTDRNMNLRDRKIKSIETFLDTLTYDDGKLSRLKKFKKAVIMAEGFLESTTWGSLYLLSRLFRKYVLGQDRFTGTVGYTTKEQSDKIGDSKPFSLWQKLGFVSAIVSGPLTNWFALKSFDNKEALAKSPFKQELRESWDMSHGCYPKLGLLFSYSMIPEFISCIAGAQGRNELIENLMGTGASVLSWILGHQATNGRLAQKADKLLAEKFQVDRGILIEQKDLHSILPNPTNVHQIIDRTRDHPELEKAARKDYVKIFGQGFALHSVAIFALQIFINQITKWRVQRQIATVK